MHIVKLKIEDDIYQNIMFLLNNLNLQGLEVIEDKTKDNNSYDTWNKYELNQIGKIGFNSNSFVDDSEDYSKW